MPNRRGRAVRNYGFSAARTTALNSRPISACPTRSHIFSAKVPVWNRRWIFTARTIALAKRTPSRSPRFASGRWRPTRKKKRCTSSKRRERSIIDRRQGIRLPLMPPEEAERPYSPAELATAEKLRRKAIVGSSEQVAARLKELAKSLDLDELVVVTWTYDPAPRHRSYELLAKAFGMKKQSPIRRNRHSLCGWREPYLLLDHLNCPAVQEQPRIRYDTGAKIPRHLIYDISFLPRRPDRFVLRNSGQRNLPA